MDAANEVKTRLNIEDVVGEYVQLKRAGRNWKGLSPFSEERTPSFVVSPEKQIWHDFSSGRGGDVFSFVMEVEGLDFKGALELLARKAGVDLDQFRQKNPGGKRGPDKERLYALLDLTAKFYQVQFSRNKEALNYVLNKRKFSKEAALEWRLGYSPNSGTALVDFLKTKGFTQAEMKLAGVSTDRYKRIGDMFRGRVMIPLCDPQGRVIGFTARLLADDPKAPKYINTPQTPLYDKSRHVFGLHLAKESIRKQAYVVVAEGNLDVISSHQAGVRQVVATAGTALTEYHLQALSRFTGDIRLCFDADKAGLNATERAIPIASKTKVSLSIISIPSGKDPDELIQQDPAKWQEIIQSPQYALDWLIDRYQNLLDITSAQGKRKFSDVILEVVRGITDPVEQAHYIGVVSKLIEVNEQVLRTKLDQTPNEAQAPKPLKPVKASQQRMDRDVTEHIKKQLKLLAIAYSIPRLRMIALDSMLPEMFVGQQAPEMLVFLNENPAFNGDAETARKLQPMLNYVKMLELEYEQFYRGLESIELQNEVTRLQAYLVERYVKNQKQRLTEAMNTANEAELTKLLEQAKELDQLLGTYKGGN